MNRKKSLAKNTLIIFIGTLCTKLLSFLLLPLYTNVLTTAEYGIVDLLTTLIALFSPILSLQISQGLFKCLVESRDNLNKQKKLITTSLAFILFNSIIFILLFAAINPLIKSEYKWLLAINVLASVYSDLLLQISRGLGDNNCYSISGVITALITILFNILFLVFLHYKVDGMLYGTLLGYIAGILFVVVKMKLYQYIEIGNISTKEFKPLIKYSLPLVPNALSWWVFSMSDRVIVAIVLGLSLTGILSVSYKFSNIIILLYNIFDKSWCENIILHIKDSDIVDYFNQTFKQILSLFLSFGMCVISFMPIIFKILVNDSFIDAYDLIPIAVVASLFQVVVGLVSVVYAANNNTKSLATTAIWSAIINIVVHILLIKSIGVYAAVVSTLVSYAFFAIYRVKDVSKKYIKISLDKKFIIYTLIVLITVLITYYAESIYIKCIGMIIAVIYSLITNKNTLLALNNVIYNKVKKRGLHNE